MRILTVTFGACLLLTIPLGAARHASAASGQGSACAVTGAHAIGPGSGPDWSKASGLVAYFGQDNSGIFQIYSMKPDGSGNQCLTCAGIAGAPDSNLHKGSPSWDPSGRYILFQAEIQGHSGLKGLSKPGSGWWNNVWLMTADGRQFWQLTNYSPTATTGVLVPRFSHDGSKVLWAELLAGPFSSDYRTGVFGRWRLDIADFNFAQQTPSILNTRSYAPGNGVFYESQDWSPDGTDVIFCSDIAISTRYVFDIFSLDLATRRLVNLTNTTLAWNEQGTFSPSGKKIAFMSSRNTPEFTPSDLSTLRAELFLMDADGSNVAQLSHFNTSGYPEYTPGQASIATKATWSPDGTAIVQEQHIAGIPSVLWVFTLAGPCGAQ
jgi:Tol biopolymer transport system component